MALNRGVETFATLAYAPGQYDGFENDRMLNAEADALKAEQRELSNALRGKKSKRARKSTVAKIARIR
jgi:putative transposase